MTSNFDLQVQDVLIVSDGTTVRGYADNGGAGYQAGVDRLVFTLTVGADGSYTFTLIDQIDHPSLNDQDGDDSENLLANGIDLSTFVVATDGDGDSVTLSAGSFTVQVLDDIPVVTALPAQTTTTIIPLDYSLQAGNVLYRAVEGAQNYDLLLTGRIGNSAVSVNTAGGDIGIGGGQAIDGVDNNSPIADTLPDRSGSECRGYRQREFGYLHCRRPLFSVEFRLRRPSSPAGESDRWCNDLPPAVRRPAEQDNSDGRPTSSTTSPSVSRHRSQWRSPASMTAVYNGAQSSVTSSLACSRVTRLS